MMKKISFLLSMISLLIFTVTNCSNNGSLAGPDADKLRLYAKVENASEYGDVVEVKLVVYDVNADNRLVEFTSGNWTDDGFAIESPKALDPLHTFIRHDGLPSTIIDAPPTLTVSNKDVKLVNVCDFVGIDKNGNRVARFRPFKMDKDGNAISVHFIYVDSDATVSGYIETKTAICDYDEALNADVWLEWDNTMNFSLKWKNGWNVWLHSRSYTRTSTERTITEQWTTTSLSELKWSGERGPSPQYTSSRLQIQQKIPEFRAFPATP